MKAAGEDVLSFTLGEPDFDTPDLIKDAAIKALRAGKTKYAPTLGTPEARGAIARKLERENHIQGLSPEHIAIGAGGKHVLYSLMQCLFDFPRPGEPPMEMLLPTPSWVSYRPLCELAGGWVREIPTTLETGFKITPDQLREAITPRTRALVLNSPSNPCATMYTEAELRALASVVASKASLAPEMVIITDEIYEKIIYGGVEHFSIGAIPEVAQRTITVNGLSKAFAMTGWRIGYCACPGEFGLRLMKALSAVQGQMTTNITSFCYDAIPVALEQADAEVERMRSAFANRAELICNLLDTIPGLRLAPPTGAFYAFPEVSTFFGRSTPSGRAINSALDFAEGLLEDEKVAVIPGEDFGGCAANHIRISFACSEAQIRTGMDRLARFVNSLEPV